MEILKVQIQANADALEARVTEAADKINRGLALIAEGKALLSELPAIDVQAVNGSGV